MLSKWSRKDVVVLIRPEAVQRATEQRVIKAEPEQQS
jgi:hypothetical protein